MTIIIVSGLPRTGTSLMMQMLRAGGVEILADNQRPPDQDNPLGYYEYEPVKALWRDSSWVEEAEGKAVKVVSTLLTYLPTRFHYKIILMKRPLAEVMASQRTMLQRLSRQGVASDDGTLADVFTKQLDVIGNWLNAQQNIEVLEVHYHDAILQPQATARLVSNFLGLSLSLENMAKVVEPGLYRQRLTETKITT